MVELPAGKTFLLTDCAMNIAPTQATLIEIVENAKEVAQNWDCITRKLLC